jgi:hypothetical protein
MIDAQMELSILESLEAIASGLKLTKDILQAHGRRIDKLEEIVLLLAEQAKGQPHV